MSHTCSTLIIRCMDFRLGSALRDYLNENGLYNDVDIVSVAGAAKDIAHNDEIGRPFLERQIGISKRLHGITRVILMHHTDCGAYGGRAAFDSDEEETARHADDMAAVEAWLIETYPDIAVDKRLARINTDGTILIENV